MCPAQRASGQPSSTEAAPAPIFRPDRDALDAGLRRLLATPLPPPRGCTHFQLRQLSRQVGLLYDAALAPAGLKTTQYSLLSSLQKLGPLRPGALARAMKLEPSTLSRNLKPLLAAGWVLMEPGADGRSRLLRITPAGQALQTQAQQRWRLAQDRLNTRLGAARVAALHALIQQSIDLLAAASPEPTDA